MSRSQKQIIHLAEQAEAYLKEEQQKAARRGGQTRTGLENRQSKRDRINQAKQKYAGSA